MTHTRLRTFAPIFLALITALALPSPASGAQVTVTLLTKEGPRLRPLTDKQALYKSPFGGWVVTSWPFSMRVDDTAVFMYQTAEQNLLTQAMEGGPTDSVVEEMLEGTDLEENRARPEDLKRFSDRKASTSLSLDEGRHIIHPFGIEFTLDDAGKPATKDPRLRINAEESRVEIVCYPIVFKTLVGNRSAPARLRIASADKSLLGGLNSMLSEFEKHDGPAQGPPVQGNLCRRITLFLPASAPGHAYEVNDVKFAVSADGQVTLAAGATASCVNGREIRLQRPAVADNASSRTRLKRKSAVSFFTYRNRGLWRRGDTVDILWTGMPHDRASAKLSVVLRGNGLEAVVGKIDPIRGGGCLKLDTGALAPGIYEIGVNAPGVVCYPLRFHVCQREALSDYEVYSYVYGQAAPYAGSPVNAYYGGIPGGPGLARMLKQTDSSLDPALAAKADDPAGPAPEKFARPTPNDAGLMALASMGMRAVLQYPVLMHHEDWNPKHTLPEDLARMRRRLALFVQPMADVAGLDGVTMGWYASQGGYWEEFPSLDGHQAKRNAAAGEWLKAQVTEAAKQAEARGITGAELDRFKHFAGLRASSSVLPNAWSEYLADVRQMAPELSSHNAIPSWWLGGWSGYSPWAYRALSHRDAVDYSDYGLTAWGNFRTPAWMNMGNRDGRKLQCNFMANQMHNRIVTSFGATGRGLDGISMPVNGEYPEGEDVALRRIFERFGSYFSALDPLPDVALYDTDTNPQNVAMHDLARMRRPAMLLGPEDVLAGELEKYRVLFLVHAPEVLYPGVLDAFRKFEAAGGIIVKDRTSAASLPGRDLGFGYEGKQVHPVWGLAYADSEAEFAHLWINFKETREKFLVETFAKIPGIPVTTADPDAVISPLAGKESILCFVANQTLVPTELKGRWRQYFILPKNNELLVEKGWHVRNLLTGKPASMEKTADGQKTVVDFTRAEGAIFLLTKREPVRMAMRTERTAPHTLRLTGWLADAGDKPLVDPMPFEVTLRGSNGALLFRKFAALSPILPLDVPVPASSGSARLQLTVQDLVLGSSVTQALDPAPASTVVAESAVDIIGGTEKVAAFLSERKGPVTILLDEGQDEFRPAAERMAALLKKNGRKARVLQWDPSDVRPLPLRWVPLEEDKEIIAGLEGGKAFAGRIALSGVKADPKNPVSALLFDDPNCGYDEYGPRLRHDADVVLFGSPETNLAVEQLVPYLRRTVTETYPASKGFFVHYLWSPFRGGYDGLYLGCRDAAGASAAVEVLGELVPESGSRGTGVSPVASSVPPPARGYGLEARATIPAPVTTAGKAPAPLENMLAGKFGRPILNIAFTPNGKRVFAAVKGTGKQLFVLSPDGKVQETRELHHRRGLFYQFVQTELLALDERTVEVSIGGVRHRYSLDDGFVSRWKPSQSGFFGKMTVRPAASSVLKDRIIGHTYIGGRRRLHAVDKQGRKLWTYDDEAGVMTERRLLYPRNLYPRAVSGNGRVLLVAAFGSRETLYDAHPANEVILGLDTATGKVIWQKSIFSNEGSVIPLPDSFMVVDDSGVARVLKANTGAETKSTAINSSAWIRPIPQRGELLIIDNDAFDSLGPAARVAVRPMTGGDDRLLPVSGRVIDAQVMADGQSVLLATARGATLRLATADGRVLWRAETPSGGIVRPAPDGKTIWVGARDGVIHRLDAASGTPLGKVDLNPYNVTAPDHFVKQMDAVGEVPVTTGAATLPPPIEASYRKTLDPEKVSLGKNLIPEAGRSGNLSSPAQFKLKVEADKTYLVELLAAAADPVKLTPQTRLEIAVTGARKSVNLPYVGRLPLTGGVARRRAAFRADESGEVTITVGAVHVPSAAKKADPSPAGLKMSELLVAAIGFKGPNLLLEEGPKGRRASAGDLECTVFPWTGGSRLVRTRPYSCIKSALRMVNGRIANEDTVWGPSASGAKVRHATGIVRFKKPRTLTSIAVYEDNTGPVPRGSGVRERTSARYGVYVRAAGAGDLLYVGHVVDNTQLVNIFACPPVDVSEIHYFWAGREDSDKTDGPVRMAEIEAYADEMGLLLDDDLGGEEAGDLLD